MKKKFYIPVLLGVILLSSCREKGFDTPLDDNGFISFGSVRTKALIQGADIDAAGNQIKVWDFIDESASPHIDDCIEYGQEDGANAWKYIGTGSTAAPYRWTHTGIHNFFGYLVTDAHEGNGNELTSSGFFNPDLSMNGRVLTVPGTTLTTESAQYDFLYSGKVTRDASDPNQKTPVILDMKHLFTSFAIRLQNGSESDVTLHRARIEFPNTASASVDYSSTEEVLNFTEKTVRSDMYWFDSAGKTDVILGKGMMDAGGKITPTYFDLLSWTSLSDGQAMPEYYISWPLTKDEIAPTTPIYEDDGTTQKRDEDGFPMYDENDSKIYLEYTIEGVRKQVRVKFAPQNYVAGSRYLVTLSFVDKQVVLRYTVMDWDYTDMPISFENEVVTADPFILDSSTYESITERTDGEGTFREVLIKADATPVKLNFNITTPVGAVLHIGMAGDVQYFSVSPSSVLINPEDGGNVSLSLTPKTGLAQTRTEASRISLTFSIESQWRDIDATEMICGGRRYKFLWDL